MTRIPAPPLLLGFAGLLPFIWATLLVMGFPDAAGSSLPQALVGDGRLIMIRYGGIILPFMSGVLWGFATRTVGGRAFAAYGLAVLPALWWFFMPGSGAQSALINLMTGFCGLLILDFAFYRWGLTPPWWMNLRVKLTLVVLICLGVGVWA